MSRNSNVHISYKRREVVHGHHLLFMLILHVTDVLVEHGPAEPDILGNDLSCRRTTAYS